MTWGMIRLLCQKWGENVDLDILDSFLDERYRTILDAHPWKALETDAELTITAGTAGTPAIYKLPSNLKILLEMNNVSPAGGGFPLRPYTQAELNMVYASRPDVGQPRIYSLAKDSTDTPPVHQVEVYPIPSATAAETALTYRYIVIPAAFDPTNTTVSPLPWIPPRLIMEGVRADLSALAKDWDAEKEFENRFAAGVNDLLRVEQHRQPNSRLAEEARY
jgi:hypothetical protein